MSATPSLFHFNLRRSFPGSSKRGNAPGEGWATSEQIAGTTKADTTKADTTKQAKGRINELRRRLGVNKNRIERRKSGEGWRLKPGPSAMPATESAESQLVHPVDDPMVGSGAHHSAAEILGGLASVPAQDLGRGTGSHEAGPLSYGDIELDREPRWKILPPSTTGQGKRQVSYRNATFHNEHNERVTIPLSTQDAEILSKLIEARSRSDGGWVTSDEIGDAKAAGRIRELRRNLGDGFKGRIETGESGAGWRLKPGSSAMPAAESHFWVPVDGNVFSAVVAAAPAVVSALGEWNPDQTQRLARLADSPFDRADISDIADGLQARVRLPWHNAGDLGHEGSMNPDLGTIMMLLADLLGRTIIVHTGTEDGVVRDSYPSLLNLSGAPAAELSAINVSRSVSVRDGISHERHDAFVPIPADEWMRPAEPGPSAQLVHPVDDPMVGWGADHSAAEILGGRADVPAQDLDRGTGSHEAGPLRYWDIELDKPRNDTVQGSTTAGQRAFRRQDSRCVSRSPSTTGARASPSLFHRNLRRLCPSSSKRGTGLVTGGSRPTRSRIPRQRRRAGLVC